MNQLLTTLAAFIIVWCGVCETINAMSHKTGHIVRLAWIALVLGAASALGELWLLQTAVSTSTALFALGIAGLLMADRGASASIAVARLRLLRIRFAKLGIASTLIGGCGFVLVVLACMLLSLSLGNR